MASRQCGFGFCCKWRYSPEICSRERRKISEAWSQFQEIKGGGRWWWSSPFASSSPSPWWWSWSSWHPVRSPKRVTETSWAPMEAGLCYENFGPLPNLVLEARAGRFNIRFPYHWWFNIIALGAFLEGNISRGFFAGAKRHQTIRMTSKLLLRFRQNPFWHLIWCLKSVSTLSEVLASDKPVSTFSAAECPACERTDIWTRGRTWKWFGKIISD